MPALFVGHGSPMNAIEENLYSRAWLEAGRRLPRPAAVLCISAHWQSRGTRVAAAEAPHTIHDFYGFPAELYAVTYAAPGSPALAELARQVVSSVPVTADLEWGLDHGAWSVLRRLFPQADVPVVQLSLDAAQPPAVHYTIGRQLRALRRRGVLILGSGNVVHNLRLASWQESAYDWALEFDQLVEERILAGDHAALIHYQALSPAARLAVPTNEHYLPLLYTLACQEAGEAVSFFAEKVTLGSVSMRSLRIG